MQKFGLLQYFLKLMLSIVLILNYQCLAAKPPASSSMKEGFVNLAQIDPSIIISISYSTKQNILGKVLTGMNANKAILVREAASALGEVQEDLVMRGFSLVVYNAYMPLRAYKQLLDSAENSTDETKKIYFPNIDKEGLADAGYLKEKIGHVRGSTVAVSIIPLNSKVKPMPFQRKKSYKEHKEIIFLDDETIDMGTFYDLFDSLSSHESKEISVEEQNNRALLRETMQNHGFTPSKLVWWQYTFIREPYADSQFDFDL